MNKNARTKLTLKEDNALPKMSRKETRQTGRMKTYKYRCELPIDTDRFLAQIPDATNINRKHPDIELFLDRACTMPATLPDEDVTFQSALSLNDLIRIAGAIVDCHVIEETIELERNYTGERTYGPRSLTGSKGTKTAKAKMLEGDKDQNRFIAGEMTPGMELYETMEMVLNMCGTELDGELKELSPAERREFKQHLKDVNQHLCVLMMSTHPAERQEEILTMAFGPRPKKK
jgi:hypothetical protein